MGVHWWETLRALSDDPLDLIRLESIGIIDSPGY